MTKVSAIDYLIGCLLSVGDSANYIVLIYEDRVVVSENQNERNAIIKSMNTHGIQGIKSLLN